MTALRNPYVGLVPYAESDAEWFFGRDREAQLVIANLRAARLTLLYGASGVGKSSLLLAGVLPRLRALVSEHRPAPVGNGHATLLADRPPLAVTVFREWRDPPLQRLAAAMHAAVVDAAGSDEVGAWDGEAPFVDWLRELMTQVRTLLVVLDQFEEYFQYHHDELGAGTFAAAFPAIINDRELRVHFLLSLREDAWARLDRFKGEIPELFGNYLRVDYLDRGAAGEAIVKPIEHFNAQLAPGEEPVTLAPELVKQVLRDVRTGRIALAEAQSTRLDPGTAAAGEDRIETPYLQLVVERLWTAGTAQGGHALDVATLEDLGGSAAIVSSHLTDAMAQLSADDQALAADVFGFLVTPSKTKVAHRASDLAYWAQRPEAEVGRVLEDLATGDRRILRRLPPPGDEEVDRYEIFHDVLAEAILEWSNRNRQARRRLEARRARVLRFRRRMLRVLAVLVAAGILVVVWIVRDEQAKSDRAARNASVAEEKAHVAEAHQRSIALARAAGGELAVDPERSLLLALAAHGSWPASSDANSALGAAFAASRVRAAYLRAASPCAARRCRPDRVARPSTEPVALSGMTGPYGFALDDTQLTQRQRASLRPDGRRLAVIRGGRIQLWRPGNGTVDTVPRLRAAQAVSFIGHGGRLLVLTRQGTAAVVQARGAYPSRSLGRHIDVVAASADGRYAATMTYGADLHVTDLARPSRHWTSRLPFYATGLAFSPTDAGLVAISRFDGARTVLWRWRQGKRGKVAEVRVTSGPCAAVIDPPFSPDGRFLLMTGRRLTAWSVPGMHRRFSLPTIAGCPSVLRVAPRGHRMLVASRNVATVFGTRRGRPIAALGGHAGDIADAAFNASGTLVATAGADGSARIWDAASGSALMELDGRGLQDRVAPLVSVAFTGDNRFAATVDDDGLARLWDITTEQRFGHAANRAKGAGLADHGRVLLALPGGRIVSVARNGRHQRLLARVPGRLDYALFSQSGSAALVVTSGRHHAWTGWLVPLGRGHRRRLLTARPGDFLTAVAISGDGRAALLGQQRRMRIWHAAGGPPKLVRLTRAERRNGVYTSALSSDGSRVLLGHYPHGARIVNLVSGSAVRLRPSPEPIDSADFNPSGTLLLTANGGAAALWDTHTGHRVKQLTGPTGVSSVVFSRPDGQQMATAERNGPVRIFDTERRSEISALPGRPSDFPQLIGYDSAGKTALSFSGDGLDLRRCDACESPEWLVQHAPERLTISPAEIDDFVRHPKLPK